MTRAEMEAELKRRVRSPKAREIYLRQDDASLTHSLERMRRTAEAVRAHGHINTSGIGLRLVARAGDAETSSPE